MNDCWMLAELGTVSVVVVYVYVTNSPAYLNLARRFVQTYQKFPPEYTHRTVIVCNGGVPSAEMAALFDPLPERQFLYHDNSGRDIGAYQKAAREVPCELMVFFGGSTYFRRAGWLSRMVEAYQKYGVTLYGATGNRGVPSLQIYPHIRTTAFWLPPQLLNAYPIAVTRNEQRYPFEHGRNCFTDWVSRQGMVPLLVSWIGEHTWENWDLVPEGFHKGKQANVMVGDRLTEPPFYNYP